MKIHFKHKILLVLFILISFVPISIGKSDLIRDVFPFQVIENLIFLDVSINGSESTYRFLFDTGAICGISQKLAEELKIEARDEMHVNSSGMQSSMVKTGKLNEIKLGNVKFSNVPVFFWDLSRTNLLRCLNIDGIIGAEILKTGIWKIDWNAREITYSNKKSGFQLSNGYKKSKIKFINWQKSPYLKVSFDHKINGYALFDTGMNSFFSWPWKSYYKAESKLPENYLNIKGSGKWTESFMGYDTDTLYSKLSVSNLEIADNTYEKAFISLDYGSKAKIGSEFLKDKICILDYKHRKFYHKEVEPAIPRNEYKSFGLSFIISDKQMICSYIQKDHPMSELQLGDTILRINNFNYDSIETDDVCSTILQLRETLKTENKIEIVYMHKGNKKQEEIVKQKYTLE